MAKTINPTPILHGEDAKKFLNNMKTPLTDKEKDFIEKAKKAYKNNPF
ncbi:MAG: hypothetical protein Q7U35_08980 [Methanobacteriaceae archaeon]|nr:hypothetical protein [Methanobacteriaceae archaeon]MDP2836653.1 hypothetical protein [Methanobacteriaceae archaeon]MDP3033581.1 hypothetical protein [Methanobacteriaceae archaeon]MDP3485459.1 hypothetical protein [Methanobacteriaceae archaeon]MDP3624915.1 hypothetical protein [Methanobacteriaceae archaeon]